MFNIIKLLRSKLTRFKNWAYTTLTKHRLSNTQPFS